MNTPRDGKNARPSCYLCETPKFPWSVIDNLPSLPEGNVVCRSCINFEGVDRIGDVIADTNRLKRDYMQYGTGQNGRTTNARGGDADMSGRQRLKNIQQIENARSREEPRVDQQPYRSQPRHETRNIPAQRAHPLGSIHGPTGFGGTTANLNMMPGNGRTLPATISGIGPGMAIPSFPNLGHHTLPLTSRGLNTQQSRMGTQPIASVPRNPDSIRIQHPQTAQQTQITVSQIAVNQNSGVATMVKAEPDNRRLQIEATLQRLNESVPFRVRFKKEPSVRGRVYGFDCSMSRPSTELKVFIEYPIGTGKTYSSASAAAKQMSLDACGGNMDKMTPISSGFKFLEYEHKHRSDDWRLLGDFLTEGVRYFKESVNSDWIPTGYNDPSMTSPPKITPGDANSDTPSDEDIIVTDVRPGAHGMSDRKRTTPPDAASEPSHKRHNDWNTKDEPTGRMSRSPKSNTPETPIPSKPGASPRPQTDGQNSPDNQNGQPSLLCFLCKQRLEASHFVQCPSQQLHRYNTHRFCFPCCQRTIRNALQETPNQEVFCPSGQRCAISGSQNPWAFMQAEIETILDRAVHVNHCNQNTRPTQG